MDLAPAEVAILVPVLRRPGHVKPLLDAYAATTDDFEVFFIADPDDGEEIRTIREDGRAQLFIHGGTYPQKINWGCRQVSHPLIFLGADDLSPQPNWLHHAKCAMGEGIEVVGVNDLIRRRVEHATHFLITHAYAQLPLLDGLPGPMCERYYHWACDNEMICTALYRNTYAYAEHSHVKHLHPLNGGAPMDATYAKGEEHAREDVLTFRSREHLWTQQ